MKKALMLLPLVAGVAVSPAHAQGLEVTGRGELRVGYDEVRNEVQMFNNARTDRFGVSGVMFGAELGVDARILEGFVLGAYINADTSDAEGCKNIFQSTSVEGEACIDTGTSYGAGVRAGIATGDGGLIYGKLGYSRAKFKGSFINAADVETFAASDSASGFHVGAGFELAVTNNVYVKAEYLRHKYKDIFTEDLADADYFEPTRHQIIGGVGLRFGGVAAPPPPPPPPPPPAPPPVATQTCPDGSVIMATDVCPLPPAPPPPPPPPPSGERG